MRHPPAVKVAGRATDLALPIGGVAALACYATHAVFHLVHGRCYDLLWACHLAAIFIGAGLIVRNPTVNGIGVLLGSMGLPLWLSDLTAGGEFFPTSLLTHVGALAIGWYGVARLGMPAGTWWRAAATLIGLVGLCRLVTPAEANVNVAFQIQHGWESYFASHATYLACTTSAATAYFFIVEVLARHLLRLSCSHERPDQHERSDEM